MINGEHDKDYEEQLNVLTCRIPRNFFPVGNPPKMRSRISHWEKVK